VTRDELLAELASILEEPVEATGILSSYKNWDSTSALGVIAYIEGTLGVELSRDAVAGCKTVADLLALAKL